MPVVRILTTLEGRILRGAALAFVLAAVPVAAGAATAALVVPAGQSQQFRDVTFVVFQP